jgi:hypothetical protein
MIATMLLLASAQAGVYEVGPGDDLANLLSGLVPGDEVIFGDGVYELTGELGIADHAGDPATPTLLRAADGATPVLQLRPAEDSYPGAVLRLTNVKGVELRGLVLLGDSTYADEGDYYGLYVGESTDVVIEDVEIGQTVRAALRVDGLSSNITAVGLHLHDVRSGSALRVGCSDGSCFTTGLSVSLSQIHDIGPDGYAIELYAGTQGSLIADTVIYDTQGRGAYLGSTAQGAQNQFEGNAIWNTAQHAVLIEGSARVRNNVVFNSGEGGILTRDPGLETFTDIIISHNTVVNTLGWAADLQGWVGATGMVLANNALCNPLGYGVTMDTLSPTGDDLPTPGYVRNNIACGLVEGPDPLEPEVLPGGGYTDFLNAEIWDFYPTVESTLVDAGDTSADAWIPELDFNGVQRDGDGPDVGAYEWDGEVNPGWAIQEDFKDPSLDAPEKIDGAVSSGCCSDEGSEAGLLFLLPVLGLSRVRRRR